jgi:hypothetical protein
MPSPRSSVVQTDSNITVNYVDTVRMPATSLKWARNGLKLKTKWPFEQGSEILVKVEVKRRKHECEGIVVACSSLKEQPGFYDTTVYLLDPPSKALKNATRSISEELQESYI